VADYLALPPEEANRLLPFVWAVDGNNLLHRLVISRELILACRDRLNFWHTLQELAGVRNPYVEQAITRTQAEERQQAVAERERLQAEHTIELEQVREAAAGEAMQRLTDILLGMDLTGTTGVIPTTAPASLPPPEEAAALPVEEDDGEIGEPIAPEPALSFDEPWIDTPLCTSCNDCTNLNPLLFLYNEDKQSLLGELKAGTYAQLVEAAELCPADCIHPGKPWNPDEPGLDELIERAVPYNQ